MTKKEMIEKIRSQLLIQGQAHGKKGYNSQKFIKEFGLWGDDIDATNEGLGLSDVISWTSGIKLLRPGIMVDVFISERIYPFGSDDVDLIDNVLVTL